MNICNHDLITANIELLINRSHTNEEHKNDNSMAKQKGLLKIEGKLDDISFYRSGGKYLARMKGGVDGNRIATDPTFQRTRENGSEFGRSATSGKLLRTAVRNLMSNAKDRLVTSRLTKVMTQIKNLDTKNIRGERSAGIGIMESAGKAFLKGFNFNLKAVFSSIFFAQFSLDKSSGAISIPGLNPINDVVAPGGATHMAMKAGWSNVNFEKGTFDTTISNVETFPINAEERDINLVLASTPKGDGCGFHLLHIEFFQEVNGDLYSLKNGSYNSLSIVDVTDAPDVNDNEESDAEGDVES